MKGDVFGLQALNALLQLVLGRVASFQRFWPQMQVFHPAMPSKHPGKLPLSVAYRFPISSKPQTRADPAHHFAKPRAPTP